MNFYIFYQIANDTIKIINFIHNNYTFGILLNVNITDGAYILLFLN